MRLGELPQQRRLPGSPSSHDVVGERLYNNLARPDAENHIGFQLWFLCDEVADNVGADYLLVYRVRLDMLLIEVDARPRRAQPLERLHQSPRSGR